MGCFDYEVFKSIENSMTSVHIPITQPQLSTYNTIIMFIHRLTVQRVMNKITSFREVAIVNGLGYNFIENKTLNLKKQLFLRRDQTGY